MPPHKFYRREDDSFSEIKRRVHRKVLAERDPEFTGTLDETRAMLTTLILNVYAEESVLFNKVERQRMIDEIIAAIIDAEPLEALLKDNTIRRIEIEGYSHVYIVRDGQRSLSSVTFQSAEQLQRVLDHMVMAAKSSYGDPPLTEIIRL